MNINRRYFLITALISSLLIYATLNLSETIREPISVQSDNPPKVKDSVVEPQYPDSALERPNSIADISVPYQFDIDENGNLRLTEDIRLIFDFFLASVDEEPLDTSINRLRWYLDDQLKGYPRQQADDILEKYLSAKLALHEFLGHTEYSSKSIEDMAALLEEQDDLLKGHLGLELYEVFYEEEISYDRQTLERYQIRKSVALSSPHNSGELKSANHRTYSAEQHHFTVDAKHIVLKQHTDSMLNEGASAEDIYEYRAQSLGSAAADRLAELDRRRAQWQNRLTDYQNQASKITQQMGITREDQLNQMAVLQNQLFSEKERIRVNVQLTGTEYSLP